MAICRFAGRALAASLVSLSVAFGGSSANAATFRVDATYDAADSSPGDGVCATREHTCTLRAAVQEADATLAPDRILLPAGIYHLSIPEPVTPPNPFSFTPEAGDLDVGYTKDAVRKVLPDRRSCPTVPAGLADLQVIGKGADRTVIDPEGRSRAFDVFAFNRLALVGLRISGGNATGGRPADGGGVLGRQHSCLILAGVTIDRSEAPGKGGAVALDRFTSFSAIYSAFVHNRAGADGGGGLFLGDPGDHPPELAQGMLENDTIAGNETTGEGGGIEDVGYLLDVFDSTLSGDHADVPSSDEISFDDDGARALSPSTRPKSLYVGDSIVNGSCISRAPATHGSESVVSLGYNIESGGSCGFTSLADQQDTDPLLGTLGLHGASTLTLDLLTGSPAINAGNPRSCPSTDQRLFARVGRCDIGAFEYGASG
jgi:hypothetical protein